MPAELPSDELLAKHGIRSFDKDLRRMNHSELVEHFGSESGRIVMTRLLRCLIWQAYSRMQDGRERKVGGNIRTFYYRWVKPTMARTPDDERMKTDIYDILLDVFVELVAERRLFAYLDFDFTDENWENRRIGTTRPDVLVFAEKTGWVRLLRQFHENYGVSTLALGGAPSLLTSEYTARHLLEVLPTPDTEVHLVALVDFDPAGRFIAHAFQNQLHTMGIERTRMTSIIHPRHYTADELELFRYPLSASRQQVTTNTQWLEATGGVAGGLFGLESESMPLDRVLELVESAIGVVAEDLEDDSPRAPVREERPLDTPAGGPPR